MPEGQNYALQQMGITDPYNAEQVAQAQKMPLEQRKNISIPDKYQGLAFNKGALSQYPGLKVSLNERGIPTFSMGEQTQQPIVLVDPTTGEMKEIGSMAKGTKVIPEKPTPETEEQRKLEFKDKQQKQKDLKEADDFISGLAQQFKNTERAMPQTGDNPFMQRIAGAGTKLGAFTGIGISPQQTADISTLRIRARSLIKKFEGGRLTDQDVNDAVKGMTDVGKTSQERLATIVNLATAVGADKGVSEEEVISKLSNALGIDLGGGQQAQSNIPQNGWTQEKEARYQELLRKRGK